MYFHPFRVKRILDESSNDANTRPDSGEIHLIGETLTRAFRVGLSYWEFAYEFKHEVPAFVVYVACVKQILKFGVEFEPPMSVAIGFMTDSI